MKNIMLVLGLSFMMTLGIATDIQAQSKRNDIPVKQVPEAVIKVLNEYVTILGSKSLEACAENFMDVAGGGLVAPNGKQLRRDISRYSLKKDFSNIKFYAMPLEITRVNKRKSNGDGYGASAIKGAHYKIWIGKKKGVNGMPAPISIIVPEGHETIKDPKVIGIGSL